MNLLLVTIPCCLTPEYTDTLTHAFVLLHLFSSQRSLSLYVQLKQFIHSILFICSWCFLLPFKLLFGLIQFNICCHSHTQRLIMVGGEERRRKIKGWEEEQWQEGAGWGGGGAGGLHPEGSLGWIIHLTLGHLRAISLFVRHPLKQQSFVVSQTYPREY